MKSIHYFLFFTSVIVCLLTGCKSESSTEKTSSKPITYIRLVRYIDSSDKAVFLMSSGKLKQLMEKIYDQAFQGKMPCYSDDSFKTAYTLKQVQERGSTTVNLEIPMEDNPDKFTYRDTTILFQTKLMKTYFSIDDFYYDKDTKKGTVINKGISLGYPINILGSTNYYGRLFQIKSEDLAKVLSKEEYDWFMEFNNRTLSVDLTIGSFDF